jgi:hypothetical protein
VAFDVVETMFSLEVVGRTLADEGAGPRALDVFFGRLLRDGFALAASGTYAPFGQVAHAALTATAPDLDVRGRARVLDAFSSLIPHPDVRPALERLAAESVPHERMMRSGAFTRSRVGERRVTGRRYCRGCSPLAPRLPFSGTGSCGHRSVADARPSGRDSARVGVHSS